MKRVIVHSWGELLTTKDAWILQDLGLGMFKKHNYVYEYIVINEPLFMTAVIKYGIESVVSYENRVYKTI